jgi:predicted nucleic acid-binding protein
MTALFFPDNTVLVNFALINRMDLLEHLANGHGTWCGTVSAECRKSAALPELAALDEADRIFGTPLYPTAAELQDLLVVRDELASPGDLRTAHLGEAETITIIVRRGLRGFFVTDDAGAKRLARQHGIGIADTWVLLKLVYKLKLADPNALWGYVQTLKTHDRGGPPGVWDRPSFDTWLSA